MLFHSWTDKFRSQPSQSSYHYASIYSPNLCKYLHLRAILADLPDTNHQGPFETQNPLISSITHMLDMIHPNYVLDLPNEILMIILNEVTSDEEDNDETLEALDKLSQ